MPMRTSVVIPTFNRALTILRALDSILKQDPAPEEVILVDDGSTDGTKELLNPSPLPSPPRGEGWVRGNIKYLHQPNRGPAAARNLGIRKAKGDFIAFLDSDDEWLPGKLKAQLEFFEKNPEMLICQTEEIWIRNGKRVNPMKKHKKQGGWIFEKCLPLCIVSPSAVMMRREFFDRAGFFDESFPACEDYELWLRASAQMPIGLIEKPLITRYGGHEDQLSRRFPVMDQFRIKALQKILDSNMLSSSQKETALLELERKCRIVSLGAFRRKKIKEFEYYRNLSRTLSKNH